MKLLYFSIIWGLLQLIAIKPLAASSANKTAAIKHQLVSIFQKEMLKNDNNYCEKAKILSKKLLQDKLVQQAKTPTMRQFKQNITKFLNEYPLYMRYNMSQELSYKFEEKLPAPSNNKDIKYIRQLIKKLGYNKISQAYNDNSTKVIKQKVLPKFEQLIKQLSPTELKKQKNLVNLLHNLKKCPDYDCQYKYLQKLAEPTPKDVIIHYIAERLHKILNLYNNLTITISKGVLNDSRMSQLPKTLKNNLTNSLKKFIRPYQGHRNILQVKHVVSSFFKNILAKYYFNTTLPSKEQKLIKKMFDKPGCNAFVAEISSNLNSFVKHNLSQKFIQFKANLNKQELAQEKPLLQWYDRLKGLHKPQDLLKAFENLTKFK